MHWRMLPSPYEHLYTSKYVCTYISCNAELCYGLVSVGQDTSRCFLKKSWENFLFQVSHGEKAFNIHALSKGCSSNGAACFFSWSSSALLSAVQYSNQALTSLFLDCTRQKENQASPHLKLMGFPYHGRRY